MVVARSCKMKGFKITPRCPCRKKAEVGVADNVDQQDEPFLDPQLGDPEAAIDPQPIALMPFDLRTRCVIS